MRFFGTVPLKTERLELRRYRKTDDQELFQLIGSDPDVNRYIDWKPWETLEGTREFLALHLQQYQSDLSFFGWAITMDDKIVGTIGTYHMDIDKETCEIGYNIGRKYWNQGIATEAVQKVLDYLFRTIGLRKVYASCHEENQASRRVMEKAGMKYEKTEYEAFKEENGSYKNLIYYEALREEW